MVEIISCNEKCNYCMWQIYEKHYGVVGCKAVDENCPTFDDVFTAKQKGIYAYFGLHDLWDYAPTFSNKVEAISYVDNHIDNLI